MKPTKQTINSVAAWMLAGICGAALFGLFYGLLWLGYVLGFEM